MRSRILLAIVLGALALQPSESLANTPKSTSSTVEPFDSVPGLLTALQAVDRQNDSLDYKHSEPLLAAVVAAKAFTQLNEATQLAALQVLSAEEADVGKTYLAWAHARAATLLPSASFRHWLARASYAYAKSDMRDAVLAFTVISVRWPESIDKLNDTAIFQIAREARKTASDDHGHALLRALFTAHWTPSEASWDRADWLWQQLALLELERNNASRALEAANSVADPRLIVGMRTDRRFDPLIAANPTGFDLASGGKIVIADAKQKVASQPKSLAAVNTLVRALFDQGNTSEALALTDLALAKASESDPAGVKNFDDVSELIWTMDVKSRILVFLGRFDEAVALQRQAARRPEGGDINVSQSINLADMLYTLGRPLEANEAITLLGGMSKYGQLAGDEVRVCAAV